MSAWLQAYGVYLAVVVLLVFNLLFTKNFLSAANFRTQLLQAAPVCIVALGMALVIGTEGVDLSVGAVMSLSAALIPLYLGYGVVASIVVALIAGLAAGLFNGFLVAYVGIQPIVATLALLVGGRGLALVIAHGRLVEVRDADFLSLGTGDIVGIPISVLVAAVLAVLVGLLVRRTTFGRRLVAIGGNRSASTLAGLPVKRVLVGVYALCGVLAGVAGVLATARLGASDPADVGLLMELSAITAVVVGGTPLTGGRVRVLGTVMGAVLMQLVNATLIKHDLPDSTAQMVQAAIIVVAVYTARDRSSR
ncbi:ABC transporter permease [Amycolatopsis sp.]|uniref:ABC transporter permease n=1 Tax=Amycolatopsis sp. TaxID=37632 RepID=UPI002612E398|nr:ABC transporter permease [Amycolatopsis sp.]